MTLIRIFLRGFLIVSLTALNVGQIAGRHYLGAWVGGFLISFVWWGNSRGAALHAGRYWREAYALGAACGTAFGIWATSALYR